MGLNPEKYSTNVRFLTTSENSGVLPWLSFLFLRLEHCFCVREKEGWKKFITEIREENEILLAATKELWTKNTQTIITFKASLENIKSLAIS